MAVLGLSASGLRSALVWRTALGLRYAQFRRSGPGFRYTLLAVVHRIAVCVVFDACKGNGERRRWVIVGDPPENLFISLKRL